MNPIIVAECAGCEKVAVDTGECNVWNDPSAKWSLGQCPTDTKFRLVVEEEQRSKNPLKMSKKNHRRK